MITFPCLLILILLLLLPLPPHLHILLFVLIILLFHLILLQVHVEIIVNWKKRNKIYKINRIHHNNIHHHISNVGFSKLVTMDENAALHFDHHIICEYLSKKDDAVVMHHILSYHVLSSCFPSTEHMLQFSQPSTTIRPSPDWNTQRQEMTAS